MDRQGFGRTEAAQLSRTLVHGARDAAFGTLGEDGGPLVSHVAVATLADGAPLLLISDLALHTRNVRRDGRASLLFVAPEAARDTNTRARVSLTGHVEPAPDRGLARSRLLRRHPDAAMYVDFADFHLMAFRPAAAHLVAGFGRIVDLAAGDLLAPADAAAALAAMDEGACAHMNEDHLDALALMATRLAGAPEGDWRAVAIDPLGIDLSDGARSVRVEYDAPVAEAGALRVALKRLADRARAAG
jgi:putative heme iron utilization protein